MSNPTAAILVIGNEVLSGRVADANLNYIARRLNDVGIDLKEARVVRDDKAQITEALNTLRKVYSYVFTTGGIGPTHDDITIATVASAFGVAVQRNLEVEEKLKAYYAGRVTAAALRMADYPAGAKVIWHGEQFAPGCMMENVLVLAGQPRAMQVMLEAALPLLERGVPLHTRQVDAWVRESQIADGLAAIQGRFAGVDIGSYPYRIEGRAGTALVCRGEDAKLVEAAFGAIGELLSEVGAELRAA
ncbi:MAG: competence/damage-inducible protein A [Proteobacteria bacterium]|nr:competence/damage-inducible protein A [Pseudomonadota bacterium]